MAGNNGGARPGAGRKSKAEELGLKEKLAPMEKDFLVQLHKGVRMSNPIALRMFAEYFYGKPKETVDIKLPEGVQFIFEKVPSLLANGNGHSKIDYETK